MQNKETYRVQNYIGGEWSAPAAAEWQDILNPATGEVLGMVPLSPAAEVERAVAAASAAFPAWRRTPPEERIQYLFRLKTLLEEHLEELANTITLECGKTLEEARGELHRAVENVEAACGIPMLMQGRFLEDISRGVDELLIRQPLGVCAAIAPFNFPGMIPFWFLPYALACGNTFIVKPSERVPLTMLKVFELLDGLGLPKGVVGLVNGAGETANAILDHPAIRAVSFVGSTRVARVVYARAAANGKRAQCQGGAKNPVIVLPDADMELAVRSTTESAFGCAGQRCLAASLAITVGKARLPFLDGMIEEAQNRRVGSGLDEGVQMGPLISLASKQRVEGAITQGVQEGAVACVDGRGAAIHGYAGGFFVGPTILTDIPPASPILKTELFGPVLGLIHVESVEDAVALVNRGQYGNMACLFTRDGGAARSFRYACDAGNIGINLGVAAPMAYFPFSGWKDSFFGDLHGQSMDAVDFFTQKKVVIERWPLQSM